MKLKVPHEVTVSTHTYTIMFKDNLGLDEEKAGVVMHRQQVIYIDPNQSDSMLASVLLHEFIHVISHIYLLKIDEEQTNLLAEGLMQFFQTCGIELDWSEIPQEGE